MGSFTDLNTEVFSFKLFRILRTFMLLSISRIIVKAPSLREAFRMIKAMFTDIDMAFITGVDGKIFKYGVDEKEMLVLIFINEIKPPTLICGWLDCI